jgi:hypothetical protein
MGRWSGGDLGKRWVGGPGWPGYEAKHNTQPAVDSIRFPRQGASPNHAQGTTRCGRAGSRSAHLRSRPRLYGALRQSLARALAGPRWLGAVKSGFTLVLHTWNQRLGFHPHLHGIVPGAGLDAKGRVVTVKSPDFLVPIPVLRQGFRQTFRTGLAALRAHHALPPVDPAVWGKDWGVHLQPFGDGTRAIQYHGAYICRTAIGDARILAVSDTHVTFRWKDRAHQSRSRTEHLEGPVFARRYLLHVLPKGLRTVRHYGYAHPAAKATRERVAFHTGRPLHLPVRPPKPAAPAYLCPCCGEPMAKLPLSLLPLWKTGLSPPRKESCA